MTKKQKERIKSSRDLLAAGIEFMNKNPIRYANHYDAENDMRPIRRGEPGYDSAPYEQRFLAIKS